jgi:hypothetical protein
MKEGLQIGLGMGIAILALGCGPSGGSGTTRAVPPGNEGWLPQLGVSQVKNDTGVVQRPTNGGYQLANNWTVTMNGQGDWLRLRWSGDTFAAVRGENGAVFVYKTDGQIPEVNTVTVHKGKVTYHCDGAPWTVATVGTKGIPDLTRRYRIRTRGGGKAGSVGTEYWVERNDTTSTVTVRCVSGDLQFKDKNGDDTAISPGTQSTFSD